MTHLDETYSTLRDCWIAGGQGSQVAPAEWRPLLTDDPDTDERRLLAIASQAFEVGLRPALGTHTTRPPLPPLARPVVAERMRPLVRRVLAAERTADRVLDLLDRRGCTMHPLDWFPGGSDADLPEVYRPWQEWARETAGRPVTTVHPDDDLDDADDWDHLYPSARRWLLRRLRASDPPAARTVLDQHFASVQAAERLGLLEVVGQTGLCDDDVPFLESLATDRSGKVKTLSRQLLMRLGHLEVDPDDLAELCTFVTVKKKVLLPTTVSPTKTKTDVLRRRRDQLFATTGFADFATALGISRDELIDGWRLGDHSATTALVEMVVATGTCDDAAHLAKVLLSKHTTGRNQNHHTYLATPLAARLDTAAHVAVLTALPQLGLWAVHQWVGERAATFGDVADVSWLSTAAFAQLCGTNDPIDVASANTLALMCPPDVAATIAERAREAGVGPHYLDMFTLSAELAHPTEGA
ncbi:MAG: DUF5691 domain-containing protein [Micrococcales bacterium]|nr:DUF5691 domain-containing protein [Micrococcales bacterium]MCL2666964.1 DUF5691 domain-containing protein [Micrococcales bacterium]